MIKFFSPETFSDPELKNKFFKLSNPIIGENNSKNIELAVSNLKTNAELNDLTSLLYEPINN